MFKFSTNLLPLLYVICVAGAPNFLIFQNINDTEFKVTSNRIETTNGANFTLICKISSNNDEKLLDSDVVWIKKRGKIKFSIIDNKIDYTIPDVNILKFASVTEKDQGKYVCKSLKHKHFRVVQLIVRNKASDNIVKSLKWHKRYKRETDLDKALKEMEKYVQRSREQEQQSHNYYNNDNSYNSDHDLTNYGDDNLGSTDTPLKIFYMLIAAIGMFLLVYGIAKCCHDNIDMQTNNQNTSGSPQSRNRYRTTVSYSRRVYLPNSSNFHAVDTNICSHTACNQYRMENPFAICLLDVANVALGFDAFNSGLQRVNHENSLDLPPSYADSTANSATSSTHNLHIPDDGFSTRILDANDGINSSLAPTYEDADDGFSTRFINASDGFNTTEPPTYEDVLVNIVLSEPANNDSSGGGGDSGGGGGDSGEGGGDSGVGGGDSGGGGGDSGGGGGDSGGGGGNDD